MNTIGKLLAMVVGAMLIMVAFPVALVLKVFGRDLLWDLLMSWIRGDRIE